MNSTIVHALIPIENTPTYNTKANHLGTIPPSFRFYIIRFFDARLGYWISIAVQSQHLKMGLHQKGMHHLKLESRLIRAHIDQN